MNNWKVENQIIGKKVQTKHNHQYTAGNNMECVCFYCSAFTPIQSCNVTDGVSDMQIGWQKCCDGWCTSQPMCSPPNAEECYIGTSSKGENPLLHVTWDKHAPNIQCIYDLNKIDTHEQVINYTNQFGPNDSIQNHFCFQKSTNCPNGLSECGRIKSLDTGSNDCRLWFENLSTASQDAYMQSYCIQNQTKDCDCVLRSNIPSYTLMKGMHSFNDGCWFLPCADTTKYFIPSNLKNPTCPTNICQIIIDVANAGNVNIDDIKNYIVCNLNPTPPPPSPENWWDKIVKEIKKHKWVVVGVTVVIAIFIIWFVVKKLNKK